MASGNIAEPEIKKQKMVDVPEGVLCGIGNPLLDISAKVDKDFLDKYGLEANNAILAEEKHQPLYDEMIAKYDVSYSPGGACQNSFRLVQWILDQPQRVACFGCIGKDDFGKKMADQMAADKVRTSYLYDDERPTGTCAVVITGQNRSLVANLAAANHYKKEHLCEPENWAIVEKADYYYVSGFHLTVCVEAMLAIAEHAISHNKLFMHNLSAPFLCQFYAEQQMKVIPYVDYLFGNETEFAAFGKARGFETEDLEEIALKAAALDKVNTKRSRIVVITHGAEDTIVACDGKISKYPVIQLKPEDIVDTNGAGDSFVGGFLAQLIQGKNIDECIRCGNFTANYIIQRSGISCDGKANYQ